MKKELIQGYAARVTQASRTELVVIVYEIILSDLESARQYHKDGDVPMYIQEIKHAQRFLNELMATLDYRYELSYHLMSLYIYINKTLTTALYKKTPEGIPDAEDILKELLKGFEGISKEDKTGPVMKNTQQLYAGLTYGRGVLNETYIDPREHNRGYKA